MGNRFNPGDAVEYVGNSPGVVHTDRFIGRRGKILRYVSSRADGSCSSILVKWDEGYEADDPYYNETSYVFDENLKLISPSKPEPVELPGIPSEVAMKASQLLGKASLALEEYATARDEFVIKNNEVLDIFTNIKKHLEELNA